MENERDNRDHPSWVDAKMFEDGEIAVRVQRLEVRFPKYSISVGRVRDGKFVPHISIFTQGQGKITLNPVGVKIGLLVQQAEVWILEQVQRHEDERLAYRQEREQRDADRDRPSTRHTGKTDRDRDRRRRQD